MEQSLRQEAQQLKERSRGEASLVHARAVADDSKVHESLQKGVASMKLKEQTSNVKPLDHSAKSSSSSYLFVLK